MRATSLSISVLAAVLLAGCGPQDRSAEFYTQAENAAEFEHALEICKKSGLSQKDKCVAVWQAKSQMDAAEDRALRKRAVSELYGVTVVPKSPVREPVSEGASAHQSTNVGTATANMDSPNSNN